MYSTGLETGNNTTVDHDDATWILTNALVVIDGTGALKGCRRRYCFKAIVLSCQSN